MTSQQLRSFRRRLNAFDQCMYSAQDNLQALGNPGFETIALLWLEGRLDTELLRDQVQALTARHPVLRSRLVRDWKGTFYWQTDEDIQVGVHEEALNEASEEAIQRAAERILSRRRDLFREPGVTFHLLHLPDGSDVLMMLWNHSLFDERSARLTLQELNKLLTGEPLPAPGAPHDLIEAHRQRFSRRIRWTAFRKALPDYIWDRWAKRCRWPRQIPRIPQRQKISNVQLRLLTRRLSKEDSQSLLDYCRKVTRFPSTSMTLLGGVFKSFADTLHYPHADDLFRTGVGVEVGRQTSDNFHPQNSSSVLRVHLTRDEVHDRKQRVERLVERLHGVLREKRDLGILESNTLFYWCYPLVRRVTSQMIRWAFSFWYAYFAVPRSYSESFGGIPVQMATYYCAAWSPSGLTMLITQYRDQLQFLVTYVENVVPADDAQSFLDGTVHELLAAARDGANDGN